MTVLRATAVIDAPLTVLSRVLRRADVWIRTARAMDARAEISSAVMDPAALLIDGQLISVQPAGARRTDRWLPPRRLLLRVGLDEQQLPMVDLVAGPLTRCRMLITAVPAAGGLLVTVDCDVAAALPAADRAARRRAIRAVRVLLGITALALRDEPAVVAAAILEGGSVLAARRVAPPALAGKWELPGGKVEGGESERAALRRELVEELGLTVTVGDRLGHAVELADGATLRCYTASTTGGRPMARQHDELRWLGSTDLDDVDWLPADRALLGALRRTLTDSEYRSH